MGSGVRVGCGVLVGSFVLVGSPVLVTWGACVELPEPELPLPLLSSEVFVEEELPLLSSSSGVSSGSGVRPL